MPLSEAPPYVHSADPDTGVHEVPESDKHVFDSLMDLSTLAARVAERLAAGVTRAGRIVGESLEKGGKILACGNGGSAADAQHFIAELVGRMMFDRRALAGVTLNVDPSIMTALANDYGYEEVFKRQVEALGKPGDVLIGISTSGRSRNVLAAFDVARAMGLRTIALVGSSGDPRLDQCDVTLRVPSGHTARVQEIHMAALHAICECAERCITL